MERKFTNLSRPRSAIGQAAFDQEVIKLVQRNENLVKQLASANTKLEAIKKALPLVPQCWGSGPKAFIEKIRSIIDTP